MDDLREKLAYAKRVLSGYYGDDCGDVEAEISNIKSTVEYLIEIVEKLIPKENL